MYLRIPIISLQNKRAGGICFLLLAIVLFQPSLVTGAGMQSLYYVKLNIIAVNNTISESKLDILPAENEFRIQKFECIRVTGMADGNTTIDIESAAKHNAISKILTRYGLKSIKSKHRIVNTRSRDVVVLRYEGVIKYPINILRQGYTMDHAIYTIETEILFSPIPFPDRWSLLYLKHIIKNYFREVVLLFI